MKLRYWDADAFIGWLAGEEGKVDECQAALRAGEAGKTLLVTSALTLTEVLWLKRKPRLPAEAAEKVQLFFAHEYIVIHDLDRRIAEKAQGLVWNNGIKPKDAVHVATAIDLTVDR